MAPDITTDSVFAGYKISGVVGRGGMSVVYAAEQVGLGRMVALKVLSPALAEDESFRERFAYESRVAARLEHPNIIQIYDAGEAEGRLYIAMRHVDGPDLGSMIEKEGPLPVGRTLFFLEQVAGALDQAHEHGLVHRDVKSGNILIDEASDRAFLTDFGVVKQVSSGGLTKTGYFLGTFEYAAPEQIEGKPVDRRTDVYALGCVLYECLCGAPPFKADTEASVIHAHLTEPPPRVTQKRPELPAALNDVVAIAMAKSKEDRYPTCGELARAFRNAALGASVGAEPRLAAPATVQSISPEAVAAASEVAAVGAGSIQAPFVATEAPSTTTDGVPPAGAAPPGASSPTAPAPAPAEPGEPRGPRTITLSGRVLAAIAAVALLVIAGIVAAVLLATGGGSSEAAQTGTGATTTNSSTAPVGPPVAVGLGGVVPGPLFKYCKATAATNGAAKSAVCKPPAVSTGAFYPDRWDISLFKNQAALVAAYNGLRGEKSIGRNFGHCNGTDWLGEGIWNHGPGKPGGRNFCYFDGNVAVIVWTHEKLGQDSHIDMLGVARAGGSDHSNLFNWYRFWHHRIGKCLEPDCVAKIS
jgi:serine/threonine-protein kinase